MSTTLLKYSFFKVRSEPLVPVVPHLPLLVQSFARTSSEGQLSGFSSTSGFCGSPFTSVGVIEIC